MLSYLQIYRRLNKPIGTGFYVNLYVPIQKQIRLYRQVKVHGSRFTSDGSRGFGPSGNTPNALKYTKSQGVLEGEVPKINSL